MLSDIGWKDEHSIAFQALIDAIKNADTLAYPSEDFLFTDASKNFWMIVITQIPVQDLPLAFKDQSQQPLAFCSGAFKGSAANWSVPAKEAYPIQYAVRRFDYLLCTGNHPFRIYTDIGILFFCIILKIFPFF